MYYKLLILLLVYFISQSYSVEYCRHCYLNCDTSTDKPCPHSTDNCVTVYKVSKDNPNATGIFKDCLEVEQIDSFCSKPEFTYCKICNSSLCNDEKPEDVDNGGHVLHSVTFLVLGPIFLNVMLNFRR